MDLVLFVATLSKNLVEVNLRFVDSALQVERRVVVADDLAASYEFTTVDGSRAYRYQDRVAVPLRSVFHGEFSLTEAFDIYSHLIDWGLISEDGYICIARNYTREDTWDELDFPVKYRLAGFAFSDLFAYVPFQLMPEGSHAIVFAEDDPVGEMVTLGSFRAIRLSETSYYFRSASISATGISANHFYHFASLVTDARLTLNGNRVILEQA